MRAARPGDFVAFYGRSLPYTARAWVAELDGEVIGVAGFSVADVCLVFSDMKAGMAAFPVTIMRAARMVMRELPGRRAVCVESNDYPGAGRFLRRLGWQERGMTEDGRVYTWPPLP